MSVGGNPCATLFRILGLEKVSIRLGWWSCFSQSGVHWSKVSIRFGLSFGF